jgi:PIN domain nuclease of toxin-antitoxin system
MRELYVIDTHGLLWFLAADKRLSRQAKEAILEAEAGRCDLVISTIVMAEAISVIEKRKLPLTIEQLVQAIERVPSFHIVPFDMQVFGEMLNLPPSLELHDRAIAATARVYGGRVITRDSALQELIDTLW